MRKIDLTPKEQLKFDTVKRLVESDGNKDRAALTLGITKRHLNRLIKAYKEQGKSAFSHGNKGRKPKNTIPDDIRQTIVALYRDKYNQANFTHYTELLERYEGICLSVSAVRSILEHERIYSPRITGVKRKRIKRELRELENTAKSKRKKKELQRNLISIEDAHSRRPRCAYFGELEQMDASPYLWFGDVKTSLHIAVDDATGKITGAYFDNQETLNGYYHVLYQILEQYGIPFRFFTDRRTVFTYHSKAMKDIEHDTCTQFAYACKQLGIQLDYSSVPQAKGRVERMFQTLQSRLPIELRLAGITNIDQANAFLVEYTKTFNERYSLSEGLVPSVFEDAPCPDKTNLILSVLTQRKIDNGHSIRYMNKYYRLIDRNGEQVHFRSGTTVMVIKSFDGNLYCSANDNEVYALEEIPFRETKSKELDHDYQKPKVRKPYIPPMSHPWRKDNFWTFVRKQKYHNIPA